MRGSRGVRRLAQQVLGGAPRVHVGMRATDAGLDESVVRGAIELALRIGEAMLSLGAPAADVTGAINRVIRAFGLPRCQVEVNFTTITLSYDRGGAAYPITLMRIAPSRIADYGRLGSVMELAQEIGEQRTSLDEAPARLERDHGRLDEIVQAPHSYRRWVVTLVLSVLAGAVAVLLGGGAGVALVAGATTAVIDRVVLALERWGLPAFFLQMVGAGIASSVAVGLHLVIPVLPVELEALPPSLVVASGIVVLLAGLSLVGSAEDAISGFPQTAGARAFEVVVLTLGIVVGIGAVLDIARRAGVDLPVINVEGRSVPVVVVVTAGAVIAGAWAVASYARPRAAAAAAVAGAVASIVFSVARDLGAGPAVASAAAALLIGFLAEYAGPRLRVPPLVISVCGIVPLLPGLAIYRGLYDLVNEPTGGLGPGAAGLLGAAMVGLGLAGGVTLGEYLAAPLRRRHHRQRSLKALRRRSPWVPRPRGQRLQDEVRGQGGQATSRAGGHQTDPEPPGG
ncbi:threonine/serine exporter ThrE family protein [Actinotalea sp. K2]|uniref:threonine/serine ThrE exporter family protein n=1 Tax=Actinotalea sp. K2 TaxID=2939438 RepID=UPI00201727C6|nr:threonine/serine exporter family protein [Actinotalea sp. K2]MCL3862390.1 threonine/serine exporter family protein [Actinotalea sp. K2]